MVRIINLLFVLLISWTASAATLSGKITDEGGQPVPFVAVYIDGTTQGTTSNIDGEYTLALAPGKYTIDYKLISFAMHQETVVISGENIVRNVQLKTAGIEMGGITVKANSEDPAYAIIRHAIKMRKYYLDQVKSYSCDVYIKGLQRILKHPDKVLGQKIIINNLDSSGIVYLSESVSRFNFKQPDKVKEEMVSSKVSGNNNAFSYNQASDMLINMYENNIQISELSERGFISPIAHNALFFYKYHLAGTFQENGHTVDKIEVIPKRRYDPVFRGYIYIMEEGWRIYNVDLNLTKDAGIDFVDTLDIQQTFLPVDTATWMVFSNKYRFAFNIFGIKGDGVYIGINKNYVLNPKFPKRFFNGEIMKVDTNANKKDSSYWKETRPVPLTKTEAKDYIKRDSLEKIHESKPYLDSIDHQRNKFRFRNIFFGYRYYNRYNKQSWFIDPLIGCVNFNTVQGLDLGERLTWNKELENNKSLITAIGGGYGFSNKMWYGDGSVSYAYNPEKFAFISIGGGMRPVQYSHLNPISLFMNSLYTLLQDENYLKIYQKNSVFVTHHSELVNGLYLSEGVEYADRTPLLNTTDYKLVKIGSRLYTSNTPLEPLNDSVPTFTDSKSFTATLQLHIKFKQEYISRPHQKLVMDSKYPQLILEYKKAFSGFGGLNADYDFAKATITGALDFHLLGESSYSISAGRFLTTKKVGFMDFYHFQGNLTMFSDFSMGSFYLLDYYKYSTTGPFLEAHYEHNFQGFIFNKIPLLRKLKLDEIVGVNYLATDKLPAYVEVYAGISKLESIRLDFTTSYSQNERLREGFTLSLGF